MGVRANVVTNLSAETRPRGTTVDNSLPHLRKDRMGVFEGRLGAANEE
jgi:hypothetical protein